MDPENPSMYFSFFGQQAGYNPVEEIMTVKGWPWIEISWLGCHSKNEYHKRPFHSSLLFADQQNDYYNSWFRPSTNTEGIKQRLVGRSFKKLFKKQPVILLNGWELLQINRESQPEGDGRLFIPVFPKGQGWMLKIKFSKRWYNIQQPGSGRLGSWGRLCRDGLFKNDANWSHSLAG